GQGQQRIGGLVAGGAGRCAGGGEEERREQAEHCSARKPELGSCVCLHVVLACERAAAEITSGPVGDGGCQSADRLGPRAEWLAAGRATLGDRGQRSGAGRCKLSDSVRTDVGAGALPQRRGLNQITEMGSPTCPARLVERLPRSWSPS